MATRDKTWFYTISPEDTPLEPHPEGFVRHLWHSWEEAVEQARQRGGCVEEEKIEVEPVLDKDGKETKQVTVTGNRQYRYLAKNGRTEESKAYPIGSDYSKPETLDLRQKYEAVAKA